MRPWALTIAGWVESLRRPCHLVGQGKAFLAEHPIRSLQDLERAAQTAGMALSATYLQADW